MRTRLQLFLMLSLGTACTDDPLTSPPATGTEATGAPTSFDDGVILEAEN